MGVIHIKPRYDTLYPHTDNCAVGSWLRKPECDQLSNLAGHVSIKRLKALQLRRPTESIFLQGEIIDPFSNSEPSLVLYILPLFQSGTDGLACAPDL